MVIIYSIFMLYYSHNKLKIQKQVPKNTSFVVSSQRLSHARIVNTAKAVHSMCTNKRKSTTNI